MEWNKFIFRIRHKTIISNDLHYDILRNTADERLNTEAQFLASVRNNIRIGELEFVIHFF